MEEKKERERERNYLVEINVGWVWHFFPGKWPVSGQAIEKPTMDFDEN